jgi:hypothetical protein
VQQRLAGFLDTGGVPSERWHLDRHRQLSRLRPAQRVRRLCLATATPNRSTASSGAYDSSCSATSAGRSATHSCRPTRRVRTARRTATDG